MSERDEAYQDVADVVTDYGFTVKILNNTEATTGRDKYGSIKNRGQDYISINAFPVRTNPSIKLLESLGIREKADAIFYLSSKLCDAKGISEASIDVIRNTIEWGGVAYKITAKSTYSQFNDANLYLILAGVRT